ncbi:MAG: amidase, partial [Actinomycetota bacterium]
AGSIRIPSALCGLSGLKPRQDRVSLEGVVPLAPSLDSCGPIARTVGDAQTMFEMMTGESETLPDPKGVRIAVPADLGGITGAQEEVAHAIEAALGELSGAGLMIAEVDLPSFEEWDRPRSYPLMLQALEVHRNAGWYPRLADRYTSETLGALRFAEGLPAAKIESGLAELPGLKARLDGVLDEAEVLVLPTTDCPAPTRAEAGDVDDGYRAPVVRRLTRICGPVNVCGLAALAVQCGVTGEGLPVGLQLVGRDEAVLLAVGGLYQSLTDWHTRRP